MNSSLLVPFDTLFFSQEEISFSLSFYKKELA
uniref:Uncharacterized protein n=1 Tax=Rhizophora mucronata TaxID=61149 RepID=A0A2P2N2Y8_RHIMU